MARPAAADEQRWVLDTLAELVRERGPGPLSSRLLFPTPAWFPDAWTPDVDGVAAIVRRLLAYAELALLAEVVVDEPPEFDDGLHAVAWFQRIDGERCVIGLDEKALEDPDMLVAALAHEVAHAYRHHHGLVVEDREEEERRTDMTAIYLGFGVLVTNASFRYRTWGSKDFQAWSHDGAGYLTLEAFSFGLAVQAVARGLDRRERLQIETSLETAQSACFARSCRDLSSDTANVRARLRMHARMPLPAGPGEVELSASVAPVRFEDVDADLSELDDAERPIGFRWHTPTNLAHYAGAAAGGATLGMMIGIIPTFIIGTPGALLVAALGGAIWMGRGVRKRHEVYCADPQCDAPIAKDARTCPNCAALFHGDLTRRDDRLARVEELEEQLGRTALSD